MTNSVSSDANLSQQLKYLPDVMLGEISSFLSFGEQKKLERALDKDLLKYSFTAWGKEIAKIPSRDFLRMLQEPGRQFNPIARQAFFTDRQEHAQRGRRHLEAEDWEELDVSPASAVERLDSFSLEVWDERVTAREAEKLILFFKRHVERVNDPTLREILAKEEDPIKKAYALCQWFAASPDHQLQPELDALAIFPPKKDEPELTHKMAIEYVNRYQDLLTDEDKKQLVEKGIFADPFPNPITPEKLSFRQLNELGNAIARREADHLIKGLTSIRDRLSEGEVRETLQEILVNGKDPVDMAYQLRQEWFSRVDVRIALKHVDAALLDRNTLIHLSRSFNSSNFSIYAVGAESFEGYRIISGHFPFWGPTIMRGFREPTLLKELLKITRSSYTIPSAIRRKVYPREQREVAQQIYTEILKFVGKKELAPLWLQDALEIGVKNQLLDRLQMTELLRNILQQNGVAAVSLELIDCVSLLKEKNLLDNKTSALLLLWTAEKDKIDLQEKFIEIVPPIVWNALDSEDLLSLWMKGVGGKECRDALESKPVVIVSSAFRQFSSEEQAGAPFSKLTSDELFLYLIGNIPHSNPSISARLQKVPIETLAVLVPKMSRSSGTFETNLHKHLSTYQVARLALKGAYGSIGIRDVRQYLVEYHSGTIKKIAVVAVASLAVFTAYALKVRQEVPDGE